eukprot:scaffold26078_cov118-Isochrysis_galbana.AAC.1
MPRQRYKVSGRLPPCAIYTVRSLRPSTPPSGRPAAAPVGVRGGGEGGGPRWGGRGDGVTHDVETDPRVLVVPHVHAGLHTGGGGREKAVGRTA